MRRTLPTVLHRPRRRPTPPIAPTPPPPRSDAPARISALRAGDLAVLDAAAPAAGAGAASCADPELVVDRARRWLEEAWASDASLAQLERDLHLAGLPQRTTSLLLAERRAVDRIRAAGLDPSTVRADVDALLALDPWTRTTSSTAPTRPRT